MDDYLDNGQNAQNGQEELPPAPKAYFYIGAGAGVLGVAAFILAIAVPDIFGVYGLLAAILSELAALCLFTTQKKKHDFRALKAARIAAYVLLIGFVLFFLGGVIYSAAS